MKKEITNRKITLGIVLIIQLLICIAVFSYYEEEKVLYDFRTDTLISDNIIIDGFLESQEIGYYIDSSEEGKEDFVVTPPVDLKFGMYKIVYHYWASGENHSYIFQSDNMDFREWLGNYNKNLPIDKKIYTANLWLSRAMPNFEVQFSFGGGGYFFISQVEIIENRNWVIGAGGLLLIIFLCVDSLFIFSDRIRKRVKEKEWKNRVFALSLIIIFSSLPLCNYYLFRGHDLYFHLMRIEGVKEGLLSGQFPVRMQPPWSNGYGYGVSLFYGDILLYFPAFLRILGMGVQTSYKCFILFINILSAVISYYCFKRMFHDEKAGLIGCMLYTASIYRMACIYVRAAVGEYCALMFLPLIITAVYEILWQEDQGGNQSNSWLLGTIGFSGVILTHVISTEITAVFAAVFCLVCWKRFFRKNVLLQFIKMGVGILVCTLWFLVPFLDMFRGEYYFNRNSSIASIQTDGIFLGQLFNIFPYAQGVANSHTVIEGLGVGDELCYSIGGGLLAGMLLFIVFWINYGQKKNKYMIFGKMLLAISLVSMAMTTVYFPWNSLSQAGGILSFMIKNIQFPWRLLGMSIIFLTVLSLLTITAFTGLEVGKGKCVSMIILFFAIISSAYFEGRMINDNQTIYVHNFDDLNTYSMMGGEYLPAKISRSGMQTSGQPVFSENLLLNSIERTYQKFEIGCSNQSNQEGYIDLPLLYYDGYGVRASDMEEAVRVVENKGYLRIILPGSFSGNITIDYFGHWYWRVAEIISLGGIIIYCVRKLLAVVTGMLYRNRDNRKFERLGN